MSERIRWAPILPSFGGRLCPRYEVTRVTSYSSKLEEYYLLRDSSLNIFVSNVPSCWLRKIGREDLLRSGSKSLVQLGNDLRYKYLMGTFGKITMSDHFRNSLYKACKEKCLSTVKRWWQTVDGLVLPILLTSPDPDLEYVLIDQMIKFGFESCANNYCQFISRMKSLKRLMRKDYALNQSSCLSYQDVRTYYSAFLKNAHIMERGPQDAVQYLLVWSQTRAAGLADDAMIKRSLDKMEQTISTPKRAPVIVPKEKWPLRPSEVQAPEGEPRLNPAVLYDVCRRIAPQVRGETCHVSTGPNACIEASRKAGGQTGHIYRLAKSKVLHRVYDLNTLEYQECDPRPVRSAQDLVSWAIDMALNHRAYVSSVRLHAVPEPSKARAITVCSLPYLVLVGVFSKLLQPAISSEITRTGLKGTRNLWELLDTDLDPTGSLWGVVRDEGIVGRRPGPGDPPILALCSDLSEATDFGDLGVARQVLDQLLRHLSGIPGMPMGVFVLAKTLFLGKRFVFRCENGRYRYFVKRSGWLMGDRLTKVILTIAHEVVLRACEIPCARICGDDVVALSRVRAKLERYHSLVQEFGFKVSEEDHFVSSKIMFYCEEGAIPPQAYKELPAVGRRRKNQHCYVDYPRIRLLIPTKVETNSYSYTDLGRFSLLGKEARWTHQSGSSSSRKLFHLASLIQHLMVPAPADVICPYIPLELGGDSSFPSDGEFLMKVLERKSRNNTFSEVHFRLNALLSGKWGYRLVRSSNLNDVVHKYHILLPKLEALRSLLPVEAVISGDEALLSSIRVPGLEVPEATFFRIARAFYFAQLFRGIWPKDLDLSGERFFPHPRSHVIVDCDDFFRVWRDLGFTFRDTPTYLVKTKEVQFLDYLNLGLHFGPTKVEPETPFKGEELAITGLSIDNFFEHLCRGSALDPKVQSRLHQFVNADDYLLWEVGRWEDYPQIVLLVSGDFKLGLEIVRLIRARSGCPINLGVKVCLVEPYHYLCGYMGFYEEWANSALLDHPSSGQSGGPDRVYLGLVHEVRTLVDHGAVAFSGYTYPATFDWPEALEVTAIPYKWCRGHGVFGLKGKPKGALETCSLTTQRPEQYTLWRNARYR